MNNGSNKTMRKHGAQARLTKCGSRITTTLTFAADGRSYIWLTPREGTLARR
jgi:hypothetical protein